MFFEENTHARGPWDYCNNINSPPAYLLYVDQYGTGHFYTNPKHNFILEEIPSVSQDEIFDIVEKTASSSTSDKGKGLNIALVQI